MQTHRTRAAGWLPILFAAALWCGALEAPLGMQLQAQTLGLPAPVNGDCTSGSNGTVTCTKTAGTAFAPSATTDTTNAANISSGTVAPARLPAVSTTQPGIVPALPGNTTSFLRGDGTFAAPPTSNGSSAPVMDTAGLLGFYHFDETSGTNLIDYSGNSNNATVGNAPRQNGASYEFYSSSHEVDFPTALNGTNTYYFAVTLPTTAGGQSYYGTNNLNNLFTNSGSGGLAVSLIEAANGPFYPTSTLPTSDSLSYGSSNGYTRSVFTGEVFTGTHVIALSCPSSGNGTFYLDGLPLATTGGSLSCYNAQTSGNIRLGQGGSASGLWPQGTIYWGAAFYSTSDAQPLVAKRSMQLRQYAAGKGAPFAGTAVAQQHIADLGAGFGLSLSNSPARIIGIGDSIMCGYGFATGKCTSGNVGAEATAFMGQLPALLNNAYATYNFGVPSATVQDSVAAGPVLADPAAISVGQSTALLQSGTNNFNSAAPANNYGFVWSLQTRWATERADAGLRPVLIGLTSRTGTSCTAGNLNCDTVMQAMNAVQRASWKTSKFAGYVDVGSDPLLGATGAYSSQESSFNTCNATSAHMFAPDGLHLCGGHTRMATAVACVLNGIDGTNSGNMGGATLTASTALTCADGGRYADPTNGAVTLTLPSAMWQTGREVSYCNVSSSTANALTLTAPGDFPFSNVSGRTSLTVAPNSCARFRATFNGNPAAPGNYWMQM